jgi:hypothetical protein
MILIVIYYIHHNHYDHRDLDPVFIEQRKQISGKLLIVEHRLIKMLRYRKQLTKALPHPYRLVYDVPERLITV